jgi:hypothetical protein
VTRPDPAHVDAILAVPPDERVQMVAEDPSVFDVLAAELVALRAELAEAHETRELAIQNGAHNVDVLHQQLVRERAAREAAEQERDEAREMYARASDRMTIEIIEREAAEAREQQLRKAVSEAKFLLERHAAQLRRDGRANSALVMDEEISRLAAAADTTETGDA